MDDKCFYGQRRCSCCMVVFCLPAISMITLRYREDSETGKSYILNFVRAPQNLTSEFDCKVRNQYCCV